MQLDVNRRRPSPDDVARIRAWAAQRLTTAATGEQAGLVVSELACREPGCPPVETVIAVLGPAGWRSTIHKPASEVSEADVARAVASGRETRHHTSPLADVTSAWSSAAQRGEERIDLVP